MIPSSAITLEEAKNSPVIENIITTNDRLYREIAFETQKADFSTKEVQHYGESHWRG